MIQLTDLAKKKFLEIAQQQGREGDGLRVVVRNGGTFKPEFALNFVSPDDANDDDQIVDLGDLKLFIDPDSGRWLEGASVDFVEELEESGFKVDAPKATRDGGPVATAVNKVLEDKINPAVAAHGGNVSLVAIEEDTAYLRFGGGCQGCGMINVTLKQGVEKVIFEEVPQIKKVMDVTDHASGTNPYYQPAK